MALSVKQRRLRADARALLDAFALDPDMIVEDWKGDSAGTTAHPTRIIAHLIRSEVVTQATHLDELMGMALFNHLFRGLNVSSRSARAKSFWKLMGELYPLQKLRVIRSYKKVPRRVVSIVEAVNNLRNLAAHQFVLDPSSRSKFKYRGDSLFRRSGVALLLEDIAVAEDYFAPWIRKMVADLGY